MDTILLPNSAEYARRMAAARRIVRPEKTVAVLMDERPGFHPDAAREIICALMKMGYDAYEITAAEFCEKNITALGEILVLPHASSVPAMCAEPLEAFWRQGGRVVVLGGPLFGRLIEEKDGRFVQTPLDDQALDAAVSGKMHPIIMEGVVPSYKVYHVEDALRFEAEPGQLVTEAKLEAGPGEKVICAGVRPHGLGFEREYRNRFIPLVNAMGEGGRAGGLRGAMASIMLSDVRMKRLGVDGNMFGYVMPTARGGVTASIGLERQDLLSIPGMDALLRDLFHALSRGLYLFEGGCSRFVAQPGEKVKLGARIMNQSAVYRRIGVRFTLRRAGRVVLEETIEAWATPNNMTPISLETRLDERGTYEVETRLMENGEEIDVISHGVEVPRERPAPADDEFVSVHDGEFWLHGKKWYAFGINYWPLYYPGFERDDYWQGWLDPSSYDPLEVERDLEMLESMGINCLFTRADGCSFTRGIDSLKDFVSRCERHGMKLSLSCCNLTSPLHYQGEAFRAFMEEAGLIDNPVMFSHDLAWEVGGKFFNPVFTRTWHREWAAWIGEQYGSLTAAEADWGVPADRGEDGEIDAPPLMQLKQDGPWRVKVCAFRRFIDDFASRAWNKTASDIRSFDPHHLIAYRMGSVDINSAAVTATNKHIDFASPEGYTMASNENGFYNTAATALAMKMTTGGKPVVWSEYGTSLTDVRWRRLVWDNEHSRPYAWKEEEQTNYLRLFYRMFQLTDARGSAPWWFPGGFRRVEMSDFGFCGPDGLLRPGAQSYVALGAWFKAPREKKAPDRVIVLDADESALGWTRLLRGEERPEDKSAPTDGNGNRLLDEVRGIAPRAIKEAAEKGETIAFRTPGTGSNSASAPRVAVGNVPLNGHNPPRYLNAEWNWLEIRGQDGVCRRVEDGACITAPVWVRGCLGNTQEAAWLRDAPEGAVSLEIAGPSTVAARIEADTPSLSDAVTEWVQLTQPGEYRLRLRAQGVSPFGEIRRIRLLSE